MPINFADEKAAAILSEELVARLKEIDHVRDARLSVAVASLTANERAMLSAFSRYGMDQVFFSKESSLVLKDAMSRLLDKQLVRTAGVTDDGLGMFRWTTLGRALATSIDRIVPVHKRATEPIADGTSPLTTGEQAGGE